MDSSNTIFSTDELIVTMMQSNQEGWVEILFQNYYESLFLKIYRIIPAEELAASIIQDVYFLLWLEREYINELFSLTAWLNKKVYEKILAAIHSRKIRFDLYELKPDLTSNRITSIVRIKDNSRNEKIYELVDTLEQPERIIFALGRFEEKTTNEIAAELGISKDIVTDHMIKSLSFLNNEAQ
ncbi:MAG: sigma-70 family RNA polymerase sigma factor [Bacteroidota bacterium]|nr:sigma-70 family RNA polymerase sigma factor [Bacteroidota bacterium]